MTKDEALKLALEALENNRQTHHYCEDTWYSCPKHEDGCANDSEGDECNCGADKANAEIDKAITAIKEALAQPEQYTTDAMKVRQAVAQALHDDVYAEELEQPEAKQSGTISITMPAPVAYLCENAVGHKYFRWKKPSSTYKPIPLYTTPPQRTWVGLTDEDRLEFAKAQHGWEDLLIAAEAKIKEKNS